MYTQKIHDTNLEMFRMIIMLFEIKNKEKKF